MNTLNKELKVINVFSFKGAGAQHLQVLRGVLVESQGARELQIEPSDKIRCQVDCSGSNREIELIYESSKYEGEAYYHIFSCPSAELPSEPGACTKVRFSEALGRSERPMAIEEDALGSLQAEISSLEPTERQGRITEILLQLPD